jgi:putative transposase
MPRKPRFYLPHVPVHVVQRGHSRNPVFFEAQDYATYAHWLKEAAAKYQVAIHAFVLMTNHIHLLLTADEGQAISAFMQYLGRRYVPYINHKYGKSGSIWEGRYKASLVQEENYFLKVMKYIELNPVRANMVELPNHYRWSSFCHNVGNKKINFIKPHPIYMALGSNDEERYKIYKSLFEADIDKAELKRISESWQSGTPLGNDYFREKVEVELKCKVGSARRGRPTLVKKEKGL